MTHQEGTFTGVHHLEIFYQSWLPEDPPKAALLIVHGLGEHSGRYLEMVNHFVPKGYAVYGLDHVGHGRSEGRRGYVESFDDFTANLRTHHRMIRSWLPDIPLFLVGQSMGGLIGAAYLLEHQSEFAGAALCSPSIKPPPEIGPFTIRLARLLSILTPNLGMTSLNFDELSSDPDAVEAARNDELMNHGKVGARLGSEIVRAMQRVMEAAGQITLPLIVLQGAEDRIVDPDGSRNFHAAAGSKDKTLKVYEGMRHEVYHERDRHLPLNDLEQWFDEHR